MKPTKYTVKFDNNIIQTFHCYSFNDAIIIAMYWAMSNAYNYKIKSVTDEHGKKIIDPEIKYTEL